MSRSQVSFTSQGKKKIRFRCHLFNIFEGWHNSIPINSGISSNSQDIFGLIFPKFLPAAQPLPEFQFHTGHHLKLDGLPLFHTSPIPTPLTSPRVTSPTTTKFSQLLHLSSCAPISPSSPITNHLCFFLLSVTNLLSGPTKFL